MAQRRMFSLKILDEDVFLDMPMSTRLLYYDLAMRADDDGFIGNPKKITRMIGCSDDDLKLLIAKQYLIPFQNGVCVIKHWLIHNQLRKDRHHDTMYLEQKNQIQVSKNGAYILCEPIDNMGKIHEWQPNGNQMATEVRLGKVSLEKNSSSDDEQETFLDIDELFELTYSAYPKHEGRAKGEISYRNYLTTGKLIGKRRYKYNHQQIYIAVQQYADEKKDKEQQYIALFSTFMNSHIVDYVEKTKEQYQEVMRDKYGDEWEAVKFAYR